VTGVTSTTVSLAWDDNSNNETGFVIERSTAGGPFQPIGNQATNPLPPNTTTFTDTGRTPDTLYRYRVYAVNAEGNSGFSNEVSVRTLPVPPAAPVLTCAVEGNAIRLSWTETGVEGVDFDGFRLERSTAGSGFAPIGPNPLPASQRTFLDTTAVPEVLYTYRVFALKRGAETVSNLCPASITTPPVAPTNVVATVLSATSVRVTWDFAGTNATSFRIERSENGGAFTPVGSPQPASARSFVDNTAEAETTYIYRVVAVNSAGEATSGPSNSVTTPAPPPVTPSGLTARVIGSHSIQLNWIDTSSSETGFIIQRQTGGAGAFQEIGRVGSDVTTFVDTSANPGVFYTYRVLANGPSGPSGPSNPASAQIAVGGRLRATPVPIAFGAVPTGQTRTLFLRLKNVGNGPLQIRVGTLLDPFSVSFAGQSFTLAPGEERVLSIGFFSRAGKFHDTLQIQSSDRATALSVAVTGSGSSRRR